MTDELKHIIQLIDDMRDNRVIEAAIRAHVQKAIDDEKQNPWKAAIIQELIVDNILTEELERDPRKALAAAIDWNCKVALDPSVSKEAMELQQQAIDAALESVADLLDSGDDWNTGDEIAEFIRSRIGTNPLAERDARIAELERELVNHIEQIKAAIVEMRDYARQTWNHDVEDWASRLSAIVEGMEANEQAIVDEVNKRWPTGKPQPDDMFVGAAPQVPHAKWTTLYNTVNEMMAPLGAHGQIYAKDDRVTAVMDALHAIDGGVYKPMDLDAPQVPDGMVLIGRVSETREDSYICNHIEWSKDFSTLTHGTKLYAKIAAAKEEG